MVVEFFSFALSIRMINFAARPLCIHKFAPFNLPVQRSVRTRTINWTILPLLEGVFV